MGEARLAQAWNALRRGDVGNAQRTLAALAASRPWMTNDERVTLARATALHLEGKHGDALALLGGEKSTAAAYLKGLCYRATGTLLKAAAEFQSVAERDPSSPLRDRALLAKADAFLSAHDYRSAGEEFARVATKVQDEQIRAEAELRGAGAVLLSGAPDSALGLLHGVVERRAGTDVAARAQFLIGETLRKQGRYEEAIVELNRVLTTYFQHSVAASAQYRVGRCLDAMGRRADATGTYEAVVSGYPLEPEAPAAAYLAGVGLLQQNRYAAAAPYFQLVLDRYAAASDSTRQLAVLTPPRRELLDAALCLLELSYHRSGNLGQLAGAPHVLLHSIPPSRSPWRAYALLIDADASAAAGRHEEARGTLEQLAREFPDLPVGASATKLLAWTYARQGQDSLAIAAEERLVARYGSSGDPSVVSGAVLDIAHSQFNRKHYREAVQGYREFLRRYPDHPGRLLARHQAALCYVRLGRAGDAVDQWEAIVKDSASAPIAEKAWARAGNLYFQAEKYKDAKRCYEGLLENFASTEGASIAMLRLAQCAYNEEHDEEALKTYAEVAARFPGTPAEKEATRGTELALYRLGQRANGTEVLERLTEQYPTSAFAADAQFQIAKRRYQEKKWTEAAEDFRRVVSRFPGYSAADQAQFLLADALEKSGDKDGARLAQEQFVSYFPQSSLRPTVEFHQGLAQFESKEYARAAVSFNRVLTESTSVEVRSASRYNLALCTRLLGDVEGARTALEAYRKDFPGDARAVDVAYQLGDLNESSGRFDEAAAEYERALAASPKPALATEISFRLGRCLEQLGKTESAIRAYRRANYAAAYKADPFRLSALARLAALYEARGDYGRALANYREIAQSSSDREVAQAAAGRASQLESVRKKQR
jgi:TolA-binding protein